MLHVDADKVRRNVDAATTEDLLDRVTAYRAGMEPDAIAMIEAELADRGITRTDIGEYEAEHAANLIRRPEGFAYRCSHCRRPAVVRVWGWHRLWGLVPVLPCAFNYCSQHATADGDPEVN